MEKLVLKFINDTPIYIIRPFSPKLQNVYGGQYIKERGVWIFPAFYPFHKYVESDLTASLKDEIEWSEEASEHSSVQHTFSERIQKQLWNPSFKFTTKPYVHQKEAFAFVLYNIRAGLFMDAGTGKTLVAANYVQYLKEFGGGVKALAVVPRVILYKWADEINLHTNGNVKPIVIDGYSPAKKAECLDEQGDIYICTYGSASNMTEKLMEKIDYNLCIVDESHNLQTPESAKTQAAVYLSRKASRRLLLSGTPSLGDPRHLYGQLDFLGPFLHEENYWSFCSKYVRYQDKRHHIAVGYRNLDILQRRLNIVGVRKTKEDCLDLPEQTFTTIYYKLSKDQKVAYNELLVDSMSDLSALLKISEDAVAPVRINKLAQILSGFQAISNKDSTICDNCPYKFDCVENNIKPYTGRCKVIKTEPAPTVIVYKENPKLEILEGLLEMQLVEPTNKSIIWAHYHEELNTLEKLLQKKNLPYVRVDGGLSAKELQTAVKEFQENPRCRVFLGQIAAGVGIDLTAANYMNYYSLDFDLGHYIQSLARTNRIGQKRANFVYVLQCKGSIDEAIFNALQNKEDIRIAITDPKYNGPSKFLRLIARPAAV